MSDRDLLAEIRENRQFAETEWSDIRAEAKKDRLCVAGQIWEAMDPAAVKERRDTKRPYLNSDIIGQYLNQTVNDVRANPRGIKFAPTGNGANDAGAEFYQNHVREIEYRSKATVVYAHAFEDCVNSSIGWLRVKTKREHIRTFNQDLWIEMIANPDQVLPDPSGVWPDSRDIKFLYYLEPWSRDEFKRRFPKAKAASFTYDTSNEAPGWLDRNRVDVGEYWKLEAISRRLVAYRAIGAEEGSEQFALVDELPDGKLPAGTENIREEAVEDTKVRSWLTNGLEILDENQWLGKYIPFVSCSGKVLYVDGKRVVLSMTRLARDPAMLHAYTLTCAAEAIGGVPRAQWVGYTGQFHNPQRWTQAARQPVAFVEAEVTVNGNPTQSPLPLPMRQPWDPPIQNLEAAIDARQRGVQAAMGIVPTPTEAQRRNDVSGVAWKERQAQGQKGSFHFTDAHDLMIERTGMILEDLMDKVLDTARDVPVRKPDDSAAIVRINDPTAKDPIFTKGDYRVTISTGPATESQRQEASDFVDTMVTNLQVIAEIAGPQKAATLLAKSVKLKQLGPIGDEIEALLAPPQMNGPDGKPLSPELQSAISQIQALQAQLQQAKQELQSRAAEKQQEIAGKFQIEKYKTDATSQDKAAERAVKLEIAAIQAKIETMAMVMEELQRIGGLNSDAAKRLHDAGQAALDRHQTAVEGAKDRLHEHLQGTMEHARAKELADQAAAHANDAATLQASLTPADDGAPAGA